ncbi:fibronectin-binding domain-containing protein [Metallosphaera tengchongensis]|uniref:Fibronectin-binding domain-containing protein n=2 Tax=Metallosphaera tengchongensis TaxID=1532350 RepID=A0A6N0P093_9CREN|nr:fibronectin-binding domain-containing protein [Metallosphaera tengchongensis]
MSYVDLLAWLVESRSKLEGCRVDNIFSTDRENTYLLVIHCPSGDHSLVIEPSKRVHFTNFVRNKGLSNKARMLRELIRGSVIRRVDVIENERILKMELSNNTIIYIELLPKGILVITDMDNKIKFVTEHKEFRDRVMKPGEMYVLPPKQEGLPREEIEKLIKKGAIARILGVPQEIISALSLNVTSLEDLERAKFEVAKVLEDIREGKITPCIDLEKTVLPIEFPGCTKKESFNEALDEYFTNKERNEITEDKNEGEIKKLESTISNLNQTIKELRDNAEQFRNYGRLLMENFSQIEAEIKYKGSNEVQIGNYKIQVNPKLSVTKNAAIYFDKAKELEAKARKAEETIQQLTKKKAELEAMVNESKEGKIISLRKKEWYEKYHWSITTNGFLVIAGRDVDQNESLVRKLLEPDDIFLHADIQGAPATIIKNPKDIQEIDIIDAAIIAASYSKAWKLGLASVDVFWVYGNQVSKSPPAGEYLPKGSFMIYGKKNYLKNVKLELAIGINEQGGLRLEAGSINVISRRCKAYVTITPGENDQQKLAERILKILSRQTGLEGIKVFQEDLVRLIPGKSRIASSSDKLKDNLSDQT